MSTFQDIYTIQNCIAAVCPLFDTTWFSPVFILIDYYPLLLTVGLFSISLFETDLFLFFFSLALTVDIGINVFLSKVIIKDPNRFPGCGAHYQMPSLATDQIIFFQVMLTSLILLWQPLTSTYKMFLLNVMNLLVLASRVYIGINTLMELFWGAITGFILGVICQIIFYYAIYRNIDYILSMKIVKSMGFKNRVLYTPHYYIDNEMMILGQRKKIVLKEKDQKT